MNARARSVVRQVSLMMLIGVLAMAQARADLVFAQGPCASSGACTFFYDQDAVPTVRSFKFTVPDAGKAIVSFNGSMSCSNPTGVNFGVVDLSAQIVTSDTEEPDHQGPGGSRIYMVLPPGDGVFDVAVPLNLAATRVLNITAGANKRVQFKLKRNTMMAGMYCTVWTASFVVQYVP